VTRFRDRRHALQTDQPECTNALGWRCVKKRKEFTLMENKPLA